MLALGSTGTVPISLSTTRLPSQAAEINLKCRLQKTVIAEKLCTNEKYQIDGGHGALVVVAGSRRPGGIRYLLSNVMSKSHIPRFQSVPGVEICQN